MLYSSNSKASAFNDLIFSFLLFAISFLLASIAIKDSKGLSQSFVSFYLVSGMLSSYIIFRSTINTCIVFKMPLVFSCVFFHPLRLK
uniref:Putative ovule protein n=1 Tax=Solanum chacoense TaxID=4108 RepID=A0A0V0H1B4_SOLCH